MIREIQVMEFIMGKITHKTRTEDVSLQDLSLGSKWSTLLLKFGVVLLHKTPNFMNRVTDLIISKVFTSN